MNNKTSDHPPQQPSKKVLASAANALNNIAVWGVLLLSILALGHQFFGN